MKRKQQRLVLVCLTLVALAGLLAFVLTNFRDNIVFFVTPSELTARLENSSMHTGDRLRLGGLVKHGSITTHHDGTLHFIITDLTAERHVYYRGIVPALFREDQGVVIDGRLEPNGQVRATQLLAKHDENYMPPEVARALKASGQWQSPTRKESP